QPLRRRTTTSTQHVRALVLTDLDVALHLLACRVVHERTDIRAADPSVPQRHGTRPIHETTQELVVHRVLQNETTSGSATLARCPERATKNTIERQVEVRIVHHDHRVLSAHLQREALVHSSTNLAYDSTGLRGSCERDHRNFGMIDDRGAHALSHTVHELDHL